MKSPTVTDQFGQQFTQMGETGMNWRVFYEQGFGNGNWSGGDSQDTGTGIGSTMISFKYHEAFNRVAAIIKGGTSIAGYNSLGSATSTNFTGEDTTAKIVLNFQYSGGADSTNGQDTAISTIESGLHYDKIGIDAYGKQADLTGYDTLAERYALWDYGGSGVAAGQTGSNVGQIGFQDAINLAKSQGKNLIVCEAGTDMNSVQWFSYVAQRLVAAEMNGVQVDGVSVWDLNADSNWQWSGGAQPVTAGDIANEFAAGGATTLYAWPENSLMLAGSGHVVSLNGSVYGVDATGHLTQKDSGSGVAPALSGISAIYYKGGSLYAKLSTGWDQLSNANVWSSVTAAMVKSVTGTIASAGANDAKIGALDGIVTASGDFWYISGTTVEKDGTAFSTPTAASFLFLDFSANTLDYRGSPASDWHQINTAGTGWNTLSIPASSTSSMTYITPGYALIGGGGGVYTLNDAGQVVHDGVVIAGVSGAIGLVLGTGGIYAKAGGAWYLYNGTSMVSTTAPADSASGTKVYQADQALIVNGFVIGISDYGTVTQDGTTMGTLGGAQEIEFYGSSVYGKDGSGSWYIWTGAGTGVWHWASSSAPLV